ncbi:DUF1302 domain-containing protein [Litoribacillus peritrichatus]|uniref:DUF1302 domain-containing protein n=1 Tax=Litoribacillus peritrichatus TaxID=718191 RepID=A0ABP7N7X9_9GAMM
MKLKDFKKLPLTLAISASMVGSVHALQFDVGDEGSLQIDSTVSVSAAWRTEDPNLDRVARFNQDYNGNFGKGSTYNYDDGSLNFKKGETYTKKVQMTNDIEFSYGDFGAFGRVKSFYDFELQDEKREHKELSASSRDDAGSDIDLLDAFVWWNTYVGEDETPVSIRAGKQVISWGESTFIQGGINSTNPVDATAARTPGAEVKDILLPVEMLYTSVGLTDALSLEAYWQVKWRKTEADPCGTFFATNPDFSTNVDCGGVLLSTATDANGNPLDDREYEEYFQNLVDLGLTPAVPVVQHRADEEPDGDDQFGIALRYYAEELNDTEFGFYYMQYDNKLPVISGKVADRNLDGTYNDYGFFEMEYTENIKLAGISFNTSTESGISLSGEISYKMDVPIQHNAFELVHGVIGQPSSLILQKRKEEQGLSDVTELYGQDGFKGYDLFDIWQVQMTAIKFFDQVLGASRLTLAGEVGATYVEDLPDQDKARYGRSGAYGIGAFGPVQPGYNDDPTPGTCGEGGLKNDQTDYCTQDGYTTELSWGYRIRGKLEYNNAFAGVNLEPFFAWSHDVDGYGPEPGSQFIEDRMSLNVGVNALYLNAYKISAGYTAFFNNADYNDLDDRDNVYASASYSF